MSKRDLVRTPKYGPMRSSLSGGRGQSLTSAGLLEYWPAANGMIGTIGESSITLTTGTTADLASATWQFPDNAITRQIAIATGVYLFTVRAGYQWYSLFNVDFAWIGFHPSRGGIAFYSTDMENYSSEIQRYLGYYVPVVPDSFDELSSEQFDTLTEAEFDALGA